MGNNNLLMEGVHVAHDALVGNGCIIGNSTKMAGEIVIDDNAIVSANVLMHQFLSCSSHVMIQADAVSVKIFLLTSLQDANRSLSAESTSSACASWLLQ